METIKNYLENMFANLPNSAEVKRAKKELLQMMEDKYNELISEGKSENEAVGCVISEFGNLDELADELGLEEEVKIEKAQLEESPRHMVSLEEAKDYLRDMGKMAFGVALGVGLCILSVSWTVLISSIGFLPDSLGVLFMFVTIALAVGIFVVCGNIDNRWKYLKKELCSIDYSTATFVHQEKERFHASYVVQLTVGILLCAVCWLPVAVLDGINPLGLTSLGKFLETMGVVFLFVICAIGVFMIVHASNINSSFEILLKLNDRQTVSGNFVPEDFERYANPVSDGLMQVYWPTVRAIYLIWSFLTFAWYKTWIIWPIAAVIHAVLKGVLKKDEELI